MFKSLTTGQDKSWQYVPNFVFSAFQAVQNMMTLKDWKYFRIGENMSSFMFRKPRRIPIRSNQEEESGWGMSAWEET
jgi:hypothetical protein